MSDYKSGDLRKLRVWAEDNMPAPADEELVKIDNAYNDLRNAYLDWKIEQAKKADSLKPTPPDATEPKTKAEEKKRAQLQTEEVQKKVDSANLAAGGASVDELMEIATAQKTAVQNDLNEIRQRLAKARDIFIVIMSTDPDDCPAYIDCRGVPGKDDLKISVAVEKKPAGGEETASKPPTPGGGEDDKKKETGKADSKPTDANADNPRTKRTAGVTIPVYGRYVLDFSLGLARTDLRKRNYVVGPLDPSDSESANVIKEGAYDSHDLGVAALAHFYYFKDRPIAPAITLGIMAKEPVRYLAGLSLVLGGTHRTTRSRVFATYGWAFGKVDRLNGVSVGDTTTAEEAGTASVTRGGHFVSLSAQFIF